VPSREWIWISVEVALAAHAEQLAEHGGGEGEQEIKDWKKREEDRKAEANISFDIRRDNDDLSYLGMDALAFSAEGSKDTTKQSLWQDAVNFRPVRNAVGHTGVLTENAKNHLRLVVENIKGRLRNLLSS
jgi:hypothetical protein